MNKKRIFLFDLDSTITTAEILPTISKKIGKEVEMKDLTERTMMGEINFEKSFLSRVDILKDIPVSEVADMIADIPLSNKLVKFLQENKDVCYIVTSNLDVWIINLMKKIGMENRVFCSNAKVVNNRIVEVTKILSKEKVISEFDREIVAVGDGSNDKEMLQKADISIGYGGVRTIAPVLLNIVDYKINNEDKLYDFLKKLVQYKI